MDKEGREEESSCEPEAHCQENDAADRINLQPRKIFDHSIAQGCYGNCGVYGGIL